MIPGRDLWGGENGAHVARDSRDADWAEVLTFCRPPSQGIGNLVLQRLPGIVLEVSELLGEPHDPARLAQAVAFGPKAQWDSTTELVAHPWHAAANTAAQSVPSEWTARILALCRLGWPGDNADAGGEDSPQYRASLALRRLFATRFEWPPSFPRPTGAGISGALLELQRLASALPDRPRAALSDFTTRVATGAPSFQHRKERHPAPADGHDTGAWQWHAVQPSAAGLAELEDTDEADMALPVFSLGTPSKDIAHRIARDQAFQSELAEAAFNQSVSQRLRGGGLSGHEIARLLERVRDAKDPVPAAIAYASALAVCMLGIPWNQLEACLTPLLPTEPEGPGPHSGLRLVRNVEVAGEIVRPAPVLPAPPNGTDRSQLRAVGTVLHLPLHPAVAGRLAGALEQWPGARWIETDRVETLIWPRLSAVLPHGQDAVSVYKAVLSGERRQQANERREPGRLETALARALLKHPETDSTTLALLVKYDGELPTSASYTCADTQILAERYHWAQASLLKECDLMPLGADVGPGPLPSPQTPKRVGSRRTPHPDVVLHISRTLLAACDVSARPTPSAWIHHHNARVDAWTWCLAAGWGLRRSHQSLHQAQLIDDQALFLRLRDKGQAERLLPLAGRLRREWRTWGQHLEAGARSRRLSASPLARSFGALHAQWLDRDLSSTLQYLDPMGVRRPWGPADLDAAIRSTGCTLPMQLMRHVVRTGMWERGVAPILMDALMGHYEYATAPWLPYSHLRVSQLMEKLSPVVSANLSSAGLE